jgi:hypothetical protein
LYHTETIEPEAAWKQKKYNPWSKLEGLSASDYMDKDIVRKSKMLGLT